MKKKFLFQFIVPVVAITCLYIIGVRLIISKGNTIENNLTPLKQVERILYKIYVGKSTSKEFSLLKKIVRTHEDEICNLALKFAHSYISKNFSSFLTYYNSKRTEVDTLPDAQLMKEVAILFSGKDGSYSEYKPPFDQIKLKVNLYLYYKLAKALTLDVVKNNVEIYSVLKRLGIYFHDMDYLELADEIFTVLEKAVAEKDAEVWSWHGSVLTKFALYKSSPVDKVEYVKRGVTLIDKAVMIAPNNMVVRLVRVYNYTSLPKFFKKTQIASEDADFLIDCYFHNVLLEVINAQGEVEKVYISQDIIREMLTYLKNNKNLSEEQRVKYLNTLEKVDTNSARD